MAIEKIKIKVLDLGGRDLNDITDERTITEIYTALTNSFGYPIEIKNYKIDGEIYDPVVGNPIVESNYAIFNLCDHYIASTESAVDCAMGTYHPSITTIESRLDVPSFEDIEDNTGRPLIVEGTLTHNDYYPSEYLTDTYLKWSLCGTHLMIVAVFSINTSFTTTENNRVLYNISFPSYIFDKIYPLSIPSSTTSRVTVNEAKVMTSPNAYQNINSYVFKSTSKNRLEIGFSSNDETIPVGACRMQFDLIIDLD